MARKATDGSTNVRVNGSASGLFTVEGYLRLKTDGTTETGLYAPDGSMYAEISTDETPATGTGRYNPKGWLRCSATGSDFFGTAGEYGTDGSLRVTVQA